jgi:Winged helix DNA-binding domain
MKSAGSAALDVVRRRLAAQQLARPALGTAAELVRFMGAVQAQDYRGSLWAIGLRLAGATEPEIEAAIAARSIVRTWPMRGTLHFAPAEDVRWMLQLLAPRLITQNAGRNRALGLDRGALSRSARLLARALEGGRSLTRPEAYETLRCGGVSPEDQRGLHVLWYLSQQGLLCQGARQGRQPTFVLLDEWIPRSASPSREAALATLATRYFSSHGPATLRDFTWWSGLRVADARAAIAEAGRALEHSTRDGSSYWMAHSLPRARRAGPAAWLLPPWDEYVVAYKERGDVFGPLRADQQERLRSIGSSLVVIDGRVHGTWKLSRADGAARVVTHFWSAVPAAERRAVREAALRLGRFLEIELGD